MEHLFKLKKEGKTVGYLKFEKVGFSMAIYLTSKNLESWYPLWKMHYEGSSHSYEYLVGNNRYYMIFDSAYPFVTKDKNNKNMFAGDKVKADKWEYEVIWQKYGYGLKGIKSGWWRQFHEFENIELSEEHNVKIPHFIIIDRRGDEPAREKVTCIDWINKNICYVNEYNEEEVVSFDDEDCELIEES